MRYRFVRQGGAALQDAAVGTVVPAEAARRLADALNRLGQADLAKRARAFIHPLQLDLDDVNQSLMAARVTRASLPSRLGLRRMAACGLKSGPSLRRPAPSNAHLIEALRSLSAQWWEPQVPGRCCLPATHPRRNGQDRGKS
jgi:hypothetical protein